MRSPFQWWPRHEPSASMMRVRTHCQNEAARVRKRLLSTDATRPLEGIETSDLLGACLGAYYVQDHAVFGVVREELLARGEFPG